MATKRKSIIEEALLEAKSVEDALKANTKEILASTMKEEINSVVRESLQEVDDMVMDDEKIEDDELKGLDDNEMEYDDSDLDLDLSDKEGDKLDLNLDKKPEDDDFTLPMNMGDEDEDEDDNLEAPMNMGDEDDNLEALSAFGDADEIDLRGEDDEIVIDIFKKMGKDDEIEVVKDEFGTHVKDNKTEAEYYIKESYDEIDEMYESEGCEGNIDENCGGGYGSEIDGSEIDGSEDEDTIYEVELDEEIADMLETEEGNMFVEPIEEDRTKQRKHGQRFHGGKVGMGESRRNRKPRTSVNRKSNRTISEGTVRKESYEKLLKEYKLLKGRNTEYKEALKVFKTKINEVALFNQNLAHVTKIFTEHSTTKKEKMKILGRFDNVETIKESKTLYKSIAGELGNKTPLTESVDKKINKTMDSSKSNLNESTAYVDPQITAIKDLMRRIS